MINCQSKEYYEKYLKILKKKVFFNKKNSPYFIYPILLKIIIY